MTTPSPDNAPRHATLFAVAERMHATCAAYDAALAHVQDAKLTTQLQNFCDENHQHLALLQRRLDQEDAAGSWTKAASNAAAQAAGWLEGKKVQFGQAFGATELFAALHEREDALVTAYEALCAEGALSGELKTLADDQLGCARARQRWLSDPNNMARHKAPAPSEGITDAGRRDARVNTTKHPSSENSDC